MLVRTFYCIGCGVGLPHDTDHCADCLTSHSTVPPKFCHWCGRHIRPGRRRFCSPTCSNNHHSWAVRSDRSKSLPARSPAQEKVWGDLTDEEVWCHTAAMVKYWVEDVGVHGPVVHITPGHPRFAEISAMYQ